MTNRETVFSKDLENKKLTVVRAFGAPLEMVWKAWTDNKILDQWWAPKPYRAETKTMDFREGGLWLYAMVGPDGGRSWCKESFKTIEWRKGITNSVSFCDEEGHETLDFPTMHWKKGFSQTGSDTTVTVDIAFDTEADMEKIITMGFQEGFTAGLGNLDDYLRLPGSFKI
jgi:uncharacterized protein YndB with AHSA1/START domain